MRSHARMAYKRCDTISDASGLGVTFIIICLRCFRVRRIRASALLFDFDNHKRIHRETLIDDLQERVVCKGEGEGCGHRGGRIYRTMDDFPQASDATYVKRLIEEQCAPKRRRRWR